MKTSNLHVKIDHLPFSLQEEVSIFIDQLLAKLPEKKEKKQPVFGCMKGKIKISEGFEDPLEDFKDYM
jgi:hypothetical protein